MERGLPFLALAGLGSPSDCVNKISTVKETAENTSGPRYGRPFDGFGPPTAFFNWDLATLKYDLGHPEALTPDLPTIGHALRSVLSSPTFYDEKGVGVATRTSGRWGGQAQ